MAVQCQPDFLLRCPEDESILPVAIFTDGFEFHVLTNRLADDMAKRRAILSSGRYLIWNLTWDDLQLSAIDSFCILQPPIANKVEIFANASLSQGIPVPSARRALGNPWQQLLEFIARPRSASWRRLAEFSVAFPLEVLAGHRTYAEQALFSSLEDWQKGKSFAQPPALDTGAWVCNPMLV